MKTLFPFLQHLVKILLAVLLSGIMYFSSAQGTVKNLTFFSSSLQRERNFQIYLPEGYNEQDSVRYPVIYFLHGATFNHTHYQNLKGILDNLIENKKISPVIVIKPDGSIGPWGGSFYTNSELYGNFEDYIVNDLLEYIDTSFKTIPTRKKRAIMGHSMGGYGAMKLALKHADKYCVVASHSAPLDFSHWPDRIPGVLAENGGVPVSEYVPTPSKIHTYLFYTLAGAFSPNLNNSPYPVDFPLDSMGNFKGSIYERWNLHDPARLASKLTQNSDLAIYFDCGKQDQLLTYPFNTGFADSLNKLGIDFEFQSFNGGHMDQLATRFPISLQYLDSVLNKTEGSEEAGKWTFKTPMPTGRGFTSGAVVDEKIYVIGGFPTHTSVTPANEMYDPATDSWTKMADMPEGRCANATCAYKGKIYVFGGVSSDPYGPATNTVFVYDPQTDSWTQKTNMPYKNAFCGIAVVNDTIYLTGGMQGYASPPISSLWAYVPLTDSWTEKAPMPTARGMLSACALNGKIYAIGGTLNFLTSSFDIVEVYDPETNIWTTEIPMPTSRVSLATCVLKDEIYAVGGYDYPLMYALNETYNPELDEWITKAPMQETRQTFFLGAVGDKIYAIGGSYPNPENPAEPIILNTVEEYNLLATGIENTSGQRLLQNEIRLGQNYPNPFNSMTIIPYELLHQNYVTLVVYNLLGNEVKTLVNIEQPAGKYQVTLSGNKLASGIYFYQMHTKSEKGYHYTNTRKLTLIK